MSEEKSKVKTKTGKKKEEPPEVVDEITADCSNRLGVHTQYIEKTGINRINEIGESEDREYMIDRSILTQIYE
jgi:hypothetical protein